jgi:hypothetical protein
VFTNGHQRPIVGLWPSSVGGRGVGSALADSSLTKKKRGIAFAPSQKRAGKEWAVDSALIYARSNERTIGHWETIVRSHVDEQSRFSSK